MRIALLLFAVGLALRVLFWLATGDRGEAYAAAFQGDAPVWQELALAADAGEPHLLLQLPLRPPAMHWLVSALWDGSAATAWWPRLFFAAIGALIAPLLFLLLRRHVGEPSAALAALLTAAASNLLTLGSGPHSELPYLVLVLLSLFDQERLRTAPRPAVAVRWAALHGLLCLLRAEHALTFACFLGLLAVQRAPRWPRTGLLAIVTLVVTLAPWHAVAWQRIANYNATEPAALAPVAERSPIGVKWSARALARIATLPPVQQRPVYHFVGHTVLVRGRRAVEAADLEIVREAYGAWPEPRPMPFVCLYGGLNFFLASSPEADGGFSPSALRRLPPLADHPERFPPGWERALPPPGELRIDYLPHLGHIVHGYRDGLRELAADPAGALVRCAKKLGHFAEGAASGLGGYGLPVGLSGLRRPVDLVVAAGPWAILFRTALLAAALAGLWSWRRQSWLWPWLAFAASKLVITALFFGYARQGALCVPLVMLGVAGVLPKLHRMRAVWLIAAALVVLEGVRALDTEVELARPDGTRIERPAGRDFAAALVRYR